MTKSTNEPSVKEQVLAVYGKHVSIPQNLGQKLLDAAKGVNK